MSVTITAGNGPGFQAGNEGNIEGDAKGYWVARSVTHRAIKMKQ